MGRAVEAFALGGAVTRERSPAAERRGGTGGGPMGGADFALTATVRELREALPELEVRSTTSTLTGGARGGSSAFGGNRGGGFAGGVIAGGAEGVRSPDAEEAGASRVGGGSADAFAVARGSVGGMSTRERSPAAESAE